MVCPYVLADDPFRPENRNDITSKQETYYHVPDAEVIWFNREALERDFPELKGLSDTALKEWIVKNFAYISALQLELEGIRSTTSSVDRSQEVKLAIPDEYGRSSVAEAIKDGKKIGLVDLKGNGITSENYNFPVRFQLEAATRGDLKQVREKGGSDGLMSLRNTVNAIARQLAIQMALDFINEKNGTHFQTVESYFIMNIKANILLGDETTLASAVVGRQPHWRAPVGVGLEALPPRIVGGGGTVETNVQTSVFHSLVDFETMSIKIPELEEVFANNQKSEAAAKTYLAGDKDAIDSFLEEALRPLKEKWKKNNS